MITRPEAVQAWFNREEGKRNVHLDYIVRLEEKIKQLETDLTIHTGGEKVLRAKLMELERVLQQQIDEAGDRVMAMTDEQIKAINRLEGHDPADTAKIVEQIGEIVILTKRAERAEARLAAIDSAKIGLTVEEIERIFSQPWIEVTQEQMFKLRDTALAAVQMRPSEEAVNSALFLKGCVETRWTTEHIMIIAEELLRIAGEAK